jgi:hypothetical protein
VRASEAALGRREAIGEVVDRPGEVGQVGVAVEGDDFATEFDGFLGGGEGLRAALGRREAVARLLTERGEVGQ